MTPLAPETKRAPMPTLHRGLIWLSGSPEEIELLACDPQLAPLIIARPQPSLLAFLPGAEKSVSTRMRRLNKVPRRVEAR